MQFSNEELIAMYAKMLRIRRFEEKVVDLFADNRMPGFVHSSIGQEAVPVGVTSALQQRDFITSTHRAHGHHIARGSDLGKILAELYGKKTGCCKGKGGSMHVADMSVNSLGATGIVGAGIPIANGMALAQQRLGTGAIVACFFGDGASNQGSFHESLNLASVWRLPVVFVCENNFYGQTMKQTEAMAIPDISVRAVGYNIPGVTVDGMDVVAICEIASEAAQRARSGGGPSLLECKTYRFRGAEEGDPQNYRTTEEVEEWKKKDPLPRMKKRLLELGILSKGQAEDIDRQIAIELEAAVRFAEESPEPDPAEALEDLFV